MDRITSSTTHGKLYQDALKLEEKYVGLVYELKHLVREYNIDDLVAKPITFLDKLETIIKKYGDIDEQV